VRAAAIGVAQEEDEEERIDQQDIFDRVISFLPAITLLLFRRVLGADDAPCGPVMGKSRYDESALEGWPRVTKKMSKSFERNRFESSQATHLNRAVGLYFGLLVYRRTRSWPARNRQ